MIRSGLTHNENSSTDGVGRADVHAQQKMREIATSAPTRGRFLLI